MDVKITYDALAIYLTRLYILTVESDNNDDLESKFYIKEENIG